MVNIQKYIDNIQKNFGSYIRKQIIMSIKHFIKPKTHGNKFQKLEKHRVWVKKNKDKLKNKKLNQIGFESAGENLQVGYKVKAKKSLGQNFLHDVSVVERMCQSVEIEGKNVIEIGPGTGFLTKEILKHNPKKLLLIEKDTNLAENLNKIFATEIASGQVEIFNIDAMKIDFKQIKNDFGKITIIANLPYNVGTTLVIDWLKQLDIIENIVVMLQKEVVDRIIAQPKTKDYGRISVLVQCLCETKKLFDVRPECFHPKPKVMSSIVKITPKNVKIEDINFERLDRILRIAFNQRRKIMSNVFKNTEFENSIENFKNKRPEELSVEEYLKI